MERDRDGLGQGGGPGPSLRAQNTEKGNSPPLTIGRGSPVKASEASEPASPPRPCLQPRTCHGHSAQPGHGGSAGHAPAAGAGLSPAGPQPAAGPLPQPGHLHLAAPRAVPPPRPPAASPWKAGRSTRPPGCSLARIPASAAPSSCRPPSRVPGPASCRCLASSARLGLSLSGRGSAAFPCPPWRLPAPGRTAPPPLPGD